MYEEKAHKFKFMNGKGCYIDHAIYHRLGDGCKVLDINDDTNKHVEKIVINVNTMLAGEDVKTTKIIVSKLPKAKHRSKAMHVVENGLLDIGKVMNISNSYSQMHLVEF